MKIFTRNPLVEYNVGEWRNNALLLKSQSGLLELINKNASFVSPGKLAPFRELVLTKDFL